MEHRKSWFGMIWGWRGYNFWLYSECVIEEKTGPFPEYGPKDMIVLWFLV